MKVNAPKTKEEFAAYAAAMDEANAAFSKKKPAGKQKVAAQVAAAKKAAGKRPAAPKAKTKKK